MTATTQSLALSAFLINPVGNSSAAPWVVQGGSSGANAYTPAGSSGGSISLRDVLYHFTGTFLGATVQVYGRDCDPLVVAGGAIDASVPVSRLQGVLELGGWDGESGGSDLSLFARGDEVNMVNLLFTYTFETE